MIVRALLFASLRERAARSEETVELGDGATVADLWEVLCAEIPGLEEMGRSMSFAVNQEYVPRDHPLCGGDEVALIPPVSGG